jgi:ABC-type transport system involved in multi-copper enzyme maturation permease subunit
VLLEKESRDLLASRAFWLLLLMIGPLVGHAFITAVSLFAEASGIGGGPAALPEGLSPLDGILVPTFGAYDLAATFFLPFVAIRSIAAEKESGALKLLLQLPETLTAKVIVKAIVLTGAWVVAWIPGLIAVGLWKTYGGHLQFAELTTLLIGHFLRAFISAGVAVAAAAILESASSAAIVTLGFTVGTWVLDFVAAGRGGWLQRLANYTPTAALRFFEQGLLRLNTALVMFVLGVAGFAVATIWLHTGRTLRLRLLGTAGVVLLLSIVMVLATYSRASWDLSENRRNSFSQEDEAQLRQIQQPLRITVYLSPEDPRFTDFEQNVLKKLRRVLSRLDVDYAAESRTGLFETAEDHYGEIWYEMNGQRIMERSTIEQVVLEQIYKLSNTKAPEKVSESEYPGYPLAAKAKWASLILYVIWPLAVILVWWFIRR